MFIIEPGLKKDDLWSEKWSRLMLNQILFISCTRSNVDNLIYLFVNEDYFATHIYNLQLFRQMEN